MALMPARVKFRKQQRGIIKGDAQRGNYVAFGDYGLQALERGMITGRQIEACRVAVSRAAAAAGGQYWVRVFPHKPMSKKPLEVRMGTGKADPDHWVAIVKSGSVMFEIGGLPVAVAKQALSKAAAKLPVKCRLATRMTKVGG
ncbi:MAG: 50S ribosomal protein L16 [Planctomycetes bacterium]|nr:50S ribosomal protein L16 [Planctomycetota bacterium]NUQ35615.1 50S ribosomal protein L16 [Planctomycetaceae bacterium]